MKQKPNAAAVLTAVPEATIFQYDGVIYQRIWRIHLSCSKKKNERYPELTESLERFLDNPDMKRYNVKELKPSGNMSSI